MRDTMDLVPAAEAVKHRLSIAMVEAAMLRHILKAAELRSILPADEQHASRTDLCADCARQPSQSTVGNNPTRSRNMPATKSDPLTALPKPADIRRELSRRLRECDVLRRLLRVAEYAHAQLKNHPADKGGNGKST